MSHSKKRGTREFTQQDRKDKIDENIEQDHFEDPYDDEFEEEFIDEDQHEENGEFGEGGYIEQGEESTSPKQVWRPNVDKLADGELLEYDPSAYVMYHAFRTEWPCLSFDFLKDSLGDNRHRVIL